MANTKDSSGIKVKNRKLKLLVTSGVVNDQVFSPPYTRDLARKIAKLIIASS